VCFPYFQWRIVNFWVSNHRYGNQQFHFTASWKAFFRIYGKAVGLIIIPFAGMVAFAVVFQPNKKAADFIFLLGTYAIMFVIVGYVKARQANLIFGSISLSTTEGSTSEVHTSAASNESAAPRSGTHRFVADQKAREVVWIMVSNLFGIVLTFGLLIPWAKVRMARHRAEHLYVLADGDLVAQGSAAPSGHGVLADAATDLGDVGFDLGL
jgi:uncharacterized membrane protein YjgN (DUF898 family)